jgi:hypothetical protein
VVAPPAGLYEVNVYTQVTTTGTGTMDIQINYQDDLGPTNYVTSGAPERVPFNANSRIMLRSLTFRSLGSANITLQTIFNGVGGAPVYTIDATCERVGP